MKNILIALLIIASLTANGQKNKYKEEVTKTIIDYTNLVKAKDVDSLLGYMYPKFFDLFPKATLAEGMKKVFTDTTILISFGDVKINKISKKMVIETVSYALVNYTMLMSIDLSKNSGFTTPAMLDMLKTNYDGFYGADNVKLDKAKATFTISVKNNMFAINNPTYSNRWWILEKKPDMRTQLNGILPDAVWDNLK